MNITKQELILREKMDGIDIIERQYIKDSNGESVIDKYITNYGDCVITKGNGVIWTVIHVCTFDSEVFNKVKKDSRVLDFPGLYEKYSDLKLRTISAFHESRVIVERETD